MENLTQNIIEKLKEEGVIIQYYSSLKSKSVYLKLDFGVLKSVRISDHPGQKHLKYRYNIGSNITKVRYDRADKRFFYPADEVDKMLAQILKDRNDKIKRYSKERYSDYMTMNQRDNSSSNGFWKDSVIV